MNGSLSDVMRKPNREQNTEINELEINLNRTGWDRKQGAAGGRDARDKERSRSGAPGTGGEGRAGQASRQMNGAAKKRRKGLKPRESRAAFCCAGGLHSKQPALKHRDASL